MTDKINTQKAVAKTMQDKISMQATSMMDKTGIQRTRDKSVQNKISMQGAGAKTMQAGTQNR